MIANLLTGLWLLLSGLYINIRTKYQHQKQTRRIAYQNQINPPYFYARLSGKHTKQEIKDIYSVVTDIYASLANFVAAKKEVYVLENTPTIYPTLRTEFFSTTIGAPGKTKYLIGINFPEIQHEMAFGTPYDEIEKTIATKLAKESYYWQNYFRNNFMLYLIVLSFSHPVFKETVKRHHLRWQKIPCFMVSHRSWKRAEEMKQINCPDYFSVT